MNDLQKATGCILLSSLSFTLMQVFVKATASRYGTFEQVLMRNLVALVVISMVLVTKKISIRVPRRKTALFLRAVCGFLGVITFFYAMKSISLADATALSKSAPFFVSLFSLLILKEKTSKIQFGMMVVAFVGVLMVIKPNFNVAPLPSLSALLSAVFAGLAYVMISYLRNDVHPLVIIFYFSLFSCCASFLLVMKGFVIPSWNDLVLLLGIGIGGGLGQVFLTLGYKLAPPAKVSIYMFSNIVFSGLLGVMLYGERLDTESLVGIGLIILAAYLSHRHINHQVVQG